MTTLVQISDPHFGTEMPEVRDALLDLVARLAPDIALLSGDITQRATPAQFAAARAFAARLEGAQVVAIPGNHDIPLWNVVARAFAPYGHYAGAFGPEREPVVERDDLCLICVDATRRWRHKHGTVDAAQVDRVARTLQLAGPRRLRAVAVHQPLAVRREQDRRDLARGHAQALQRWSEAGVDVVLCGHIHLADVLAVHDQQRWPRRHLWVLQAGTAISSRVRPPSGNSVNVLRCERRCGGPLEAMAERWDYAPRQGHFAHVASFPLALGPRLQR